ncbi:MAG TPA: hypothetical protein VNH46_00095 [Gemmatimonadales bacterium]|nr:hypothetical protein [Gemmatimonadales bacterium]
MHTTINRVRLGALAALALGLGACSGSNSTTSPASPTTAPLSRADAQAVGEEMVNEMGDIADRASMHDLMAPSFPVPWASEGFYHGPRFFTPTAGCPTLSPNPPTDADGDHVPDDLTITYDPSVCTFSSFHDHATLTLSGSLHIVDPSQTSPGVRLEFNALQSKFTVDTVYWLRQIDGVWQIVSSATGFSSSDTTTVTHQSSRFGTAQLVKQWQVDFTADQGQTFGNDQALPSGDFTVNGSTSRTASTHMRSFTVTTVTPLHYDATCMAANRIVSGEMTLSTTTSNGTNTVDIVFNACGTDPTITLQTPPTT